MPATAPLATPGYTITHAYYPVPSASRPGIVHAVSVNPKTGAILKCSCEDFRYRRDGQHQLCRHAEAVRRGEGGKIRLGVRPNPPRAIGATSAGRVTRPSRERDHGAGPVAPISDLYGD